MLLRTTLWNAKFQNDTSCAEIILLKFHTCLISYWHCHRICSKYILNLHTTSNACAIRYLPVEIFLQESAVTHVARNTGAGIPTYHLITLNIPDINPVDYAIIACLPVVCVQRVNELKQQLLNVGLVIEHRVSLTVQLTYSPCTADNTDNIAAMSRQTEKKSVISN